MTVHHQQDTAWKIIFDSYFKDFVAYCLPDLFNQIDWSKPYTPLDKELSAIAKGTKTGNRLLDKLFQVYLKNGSKISILLHLEIQARKEDDFPYRMFTYAYRIFDRYQQPVLSCAILSDTHKDWRPSHYQVGLGDMGLRLKYHVVKLLDYRKEYAALETSNNPFASVILVQLEAIAAKNKSAIERKNIKFALMRRLYEKKYHKEEICNLYRFVDWLFCLPDALEIEYIDEIHVLEEAKKMTYVTSVERFKKEIAMRIGLRKGEKKGLKRGQEIGLRKGREIGQEIGLRKGEEKGFKRGREEGLLIVAKQLLELGQDLILIARATKLPLKKIKQLQKELHDQK